MTSEFTDWFYAKTDITFCLLKLTTIEKDEDWIEALQFLTKSILSSTNGRISKTAIHFNDKVRFK